MILVSIQYSSFPGDPTSKTIFTGRTREGVVDDNVSVLFQVQTIGKITYPARPVSDDDIPIPQSSTSMRWVENLYLSGPGYLRWMMAYAYSIMHWRRKKVFPLAKKMWILVLSTQTFTPHSYIFLSYLIEIIIHWLFSLLELSIASILAGFPSSYLVF